MAAASGTAATFSIRTPAPGLRRPCAGAAAAGGGAKWWAPLLGWSGQPDYIDSQPAAEPAPKEERGKRRFGVLTEEKARQLRLRMMETESFHDVMYHSAIASRLASAPPDTARRTKP
ncbi:uncharacterized protein LOC119281014 [Triticum dicoccoides]|uniref:uncharacterized protein LOC119281014 n=1 Tax=Triticum dicoccoides TaxID=85692 RepID=UPI000E7A57FA|nr:uncharacterized protein LOC119281014 [Triticum dicoccoides]